MRSLGHRISLCGIALSAFTYLAAGLPVDDQVDISSRDAQAILSTVNPSKLSQHPHHLADASSSLFASTHALLRSWSEAFAPIGWNIVPGYIPIGTQLYHGTNSASAPTSGLEWFAFDPEHAYFFAAWRGGSLHTFEATVPLPILYFDGFSAAKGTPGTVDLQNIIAFGNATSPWSSEFEAEFDRAQRLCDWAQSFGFGGIIREEAAFELIWCDFGRSVAHIRGVNVTTPTPTESTESVDFSAQPDLDSPLGTALDDPLGTSNILRLPDRQWGPVGARSLYLKAHSWRFLSATSTHFVQRDPRIILSIQHMTSLHDPRYISIRNQHALPSYKRRLLNISGEDISEFKKQVEKAGARWRNRPAMSSAPDYAGIIDEMVKRKTLALQQIKLTLEKPNVTEAFLYTKVLAYGGLFSYFNGPEALNTGPDAPSVDQQLDSLRQGIEACATTLIVHGGDNLLSVAIGRVQRRICEFEGSILISAAELELRSQVGMSTQTSLVREWREQLERLLDWLKWPTLITCSGGCEDDQICIIPMWPIDGDGMFSPVRIPVGEFTPRCVGWDLLD